MKNMNAKKAKKLRRRARELTAHAPEVSYHSEKVSKQRRLAECTKGAYRALKSGRFDHVIIE
jgi:hypothetical protein